MSPDEAARCLRASRTLKRISAAAGDAPLFLTGGSLRDRLLGLVTHDIDLVTTGEPRALAARLGRELGGRPVRLGREPHVAWRLAATSDRWTSSGRRGRCTRTSCAATSPSTPCSGDCRTVPCSTSPAAWRTSPPAACARCATSTWSTTPSVCSARSGSRPPAPSCASPSRPSASSPRRRRGRQARHGSVCWRSSPPSRRTGSGTRPARRGPLPAAGAAAAGLADLRPGARVGTRGWAVGGDRAPPRRLRCGGRRCRHRDLGRTGGRLPRALGPRSGRQSAGPRGVPGAPRTTRQPGGGASPCGSLACSARTSATPATSPSKPDRSSRCRWPGRFPGTTRVNRR